MKVEQLTMDFMLMDKHCVKNIMDECYFQACCESSRCECCSGCEQANTCISRCVKSYRYIHEYDEGLIRRHTEVNMLPILNHNCGTVLLYEYAGGNRAYGFVKKKEAQ